MKKKFALLLTVCLAINSLTGCNYREIKQTVAAISIESMGLLANASIVTDSKVLSQSTDTNSIKIVFENGVIIKTMYHDTVKNNKELNMECTFEGPKDIIENKMLDYIKICFTDFNPVQLSNIEDALLTTGQYDIKTDGDYYSMQYMDGYLSLSFQN